MLRKDQTNSRASPDHTSMASIVACHCVGSTRAALALHTRFEEIRAYLLARPPPPLLYVFRRSGPKMPKARGTKDLCLYLSEWGDRLLRFVLSWISFVPISDIEKATLHHM